jgi:predicted dehydrogenase
MKRKVNWGILGCAKIAERSIIPAIRESRTGVIYGIASRDEKKARSWKDQFGFITLYPDYQALINAPQIDVVYIPLANHLHCEWAVKAAKAGKHVVVEKPACLSTDEAKKMIDEAKKNNVLLMEAFMWKYHPQTEKILRIIKRGNIGEPLFFHSAFTFNYTNDPSNYRWDPKMGGGSLYDIGCYTISAARTMFGLEPVSVYATARIDAKKKVDTSCSMILEFPNGKTAHLDCSFEAQFQSYYEVIGPKGTVKAPRAFSQRMRSVTLETLKGELFKVVNVPRVNQYARMVETVNECIRHGKDLPVKPEDILNNVKVIEAAFKSIETGKPVKI